ncbi:T9SS type A sorting domain-containing protein [Chryseobacterium chendengshani]|uniref:T9SS type A sorting domain-containing protein n=1 Tax=Chryseobacterium sp. LJ668 TaxID=2864040 RepID=UPI001C68B838|nr:T9SS type A sorting domain-containing protein [Chryseobacterium sp. LJ668]MBW8522347.1 T9SS type A sorting domain-containing protein [Chryseobacterium sp. LJ668]QYK17986.1 T9SS type A sorting domain-containing protein [Chryseobacterium sp. LJ668]
MKQFYKFYISRNTTNYLEKTMLIVVFFLIFQFNANAQVSSYTFTQSNGTYTSITGTVLGAATGNTAATNLDSNVYPVTLPFGFNLSGVPQSSINVSSNGFITFGATAPATSNTTPLSNAASYDGAVSAFGKDLSSFSNVGGKSGSISWETVGVAPNREVVIQWDNFRTNSSTSITSVFSFSFQIRLQETTNIIRVVYNSGSFLVGSTAVSSTAQIGLRGNLNTDFNTRLNSTSLEFFNSTAGTANSSSQSYNTSNSVPGMPNAGLTYIWTPPTCFPPSGVTLNNSSSNSASLSWAASVSTPAGYDIYYNTDNTPPISSTAPMVVNSPGTTATINSLSPAITYYLWIRSNCGTGNVSEWIIKPFIFRTLCAPVNILSTTGFTACPNQPATLSATATAGANIIWYDASGNLVGTGNSFTTPSLATTTTYYAAASSGAVSSLITTGKNTYTPNPTSGSGTTEFGLVFDVLSPFTLKEVTIFPTSSTSASGTVTIDVVDREGTLVHSKIVNVAASPTASPVAQVVTLDFPLVVGTGYKIRHSARSAGIAGLLFDPSANAPSSNYGYPYVTTNVLSINTSSLTATNVPRNDLYYYFYNWKIGPGCESPRVAVVATVDSNCLSTSETDKKDAVKVHPNPFSDVVNINKPELVKTIRVSDVSGKLLRTINQPESAVKLNEFSAGMYILQLDMKDGSKQSIKIIKK